MINERPVSYSVKKVLADPATNNLIIIFCSAILLLTIKNNDIDAWNIVPLLLIYSLSLSYSFMALLIVAFDEKNKITLKLDYLFCGRNIHWFEIQSTLALILAFANIPWICITKIRFGAQIISCLSVVNVLLFTLEYKSAAKESQKYFHEENIPHLKTGVSCFLKIFNRFSLFINLIRIGSLSAALFLVIKNQNFDSSINYTIYCFCISLAASLMIFVLQLTAVFKNYNITELKAKDKWITNSMLTILLHTMLATLAFSLVIGNYEFRIRINDIQDGSTTYATTTLSYPQIRVNGIGYYRIITPFNAPLESPFAFALSASTFVISVLELYSRTIYSQSRFDKDAPLYRKDVLTI